jgi:hypothetical protein
MVADSGDAGCRRITWVATLSIFATILLGAIEGSSEDSRSRILISIRGALWQSPSTRSRSGSERGYKVVLSNGVFAALHITYGVLLLEQMGVVLRNMLDYTTINHRHRVVMCRSTSADHRISPASPMHTSCIEPCTCVFAVTGSGIW